LRQPEAPGQDLWSGIPLAGAPVPFASLLRQTPHNAVVMARK
jgi:hypothetical protein